MIKTLRITGVIAAVLAVGFFVFSAVYGFRSDPKIEEFLKLPSVVDEFKKTRGNRTRRKKDQESPLVVQAGIFARYLNPPPAPPPTTRTPDRTKGPRISPPRAEPPVSAKFTVVATSFCESAPELSLALVDEPAKGRHWVRPKTVINHVTIEQIRDGYLVVREAQGTREIPVDQRPPTRRDFLLGSAPVSTGPGAAPGHVAATVSPSPQLRATSRPAAGTRTGRVPAQPAATSAESVAMMEKFLGDFKAMQPTGSPDKIGSGAQQHNETVALMEGLIDQLKEMEAAGAKVSPGRGGKNAPVQNSLSDADATRVTGEEAKKLARLGPQLKKDAEGNTAAVRRPYNRRNRHRELLERRKRLLEKKAKGEEASAEQADPDAQ